MAMAVAVIPVLADAPPVTVVTRLAGSVHTGNPKLWLLQIPVERPDSHSFYISNSICKMQKTCFQHAGNNSSCSSY